jgi:hypothetical protein
MRIVLLAAALSACAPSFSEEAATTFASEYSCPLQRETIVHGEPPAEIAADPERAKVWNEHHHMYTVSGCGATQRFACNVIGGDVTNQQVACSPG